MTINEIKKLINTNEYSFLFTDPHLGESLMFLVLGGSYSYGTNIETSDIDIRGCARNNVNDLLGLSNFEQYVKNEPDTTVYAFNKFINLLLNCNPNVIEMLGCKPEHYVYMTPEGQELIDNRKLFLSQRAVNSFGGYANSQLRRLENAIANDRVSQEKKEEHILGSMKNAIATFNVRYSSFEDKNIKLYTDVSDKVDRATEIFADVSLKHYPVREFIGIMNELTNICGCYDKLNHRNNKKDEAHLNKHAMHLIRLYLMCIDILEKEDIITYRENDHELLMSIRNGAFQNEDGTYQQDFFDLVNQLEERMKYAVRETSLPKTPNMTKIEEYVKSVNLGTVKNQLL